MSFIGIVIFFVVSIFGIVASVGYWVYKDAKVRSDKPGLWTLIAVVTPNLFGLIIYLFVGRTKAGKSGRRHKIPIIVCSICLVISFSLLMGRIFFPGFGDLPILSGVSIGQYQVMGETKWELSFKTSDNTMNRTVILNEDQLKVFRVKADSEEGTITLIISQVDNSNTHTISNFEGVIDLSDFCKPFLPIRITIVNESVRNGNIVIEWGE